MVFSKLSDKEMQGWQQDGFVLLKSLFDQEEMSLLLETSKADHVLAKNAQVLKDSAGGKSKLTIWNHPGDDLYGMFSRCERIVNTTEQLLDGEVYHYHSKVMIKEPMVGGAWEWHQDYGYWYDLGCLYPDMLSCYVSIDQASKKNGCLQVIPGSQRLGRLDHGAQGDQAGITQERIDAILTRLPLLYCEMSPGDALFFHGNLLHRSDQNKSPDPRWSLICCYNAARNNPYKASDHPQYTPIKKVADTAIKQVGQKALSAQNSSFLNMGKNDNIKKRQMATAQTTA